MGVQVIGWPFPPPSIFSSSSSFSSQKSASTLCFLYPQLRRANKITKGWVGGGGGGGDAARIRHALSKGSAIIQTCRGSSRRRLDVDGDSDDVQKNNININGVSKKIFENPRYMINEDDEKIRNRNMGFGHHSRLEIWPELTSSSSSSWEGRSESDEIARASIERKAGRFDIPLSLRMIKKRKKQLEGNGEMTCSSTKKAFSSVVFIIGEVQSHYTTCQSHHWELHASFVWLFQHVFSKTPTLMLCLMILLADSTLYSLLIHNDDDDEAETAALVLIKKRWRANHFEFSTLTSPEEEDEKLWNSVATRRNKVSDHPPTAPVGVLEPERTDDHDYIEYFTRDLQYQIRIYEDPNNPLLLSNYGQFLCLFARDHERAEECFKRAVALEVDGEALSRYANFLWIIRKDLWGAEEAFLQAMAADPANPYHLSNYATFLWNTGGGDFCFSHHLSATEH